MGGAGGRRADANFPPRPSRRIVQDEIEFPSAETLAAAERTPVSSDLRTIVSALLVREPVGSRLGSGNSGTDDVKRASWFGSSDWWEQVAQKKIVPEFVPPQEDTEMGRNFDEGELACPCACPGASSSNPPSARPTEFTSEPARDSVVAGPEGGIEFERWSYAGGAETR